MMSNFKSNVLLLLSASAISQLIAVVAIPVLSQFYSPEQFGTYGLYISISSIIASVAAGKFDLALMLPKEKKQVNSLFTLSSLLIFFVFCVVFIISYVFKDYLFQKTTSVLFSDYYFLIPVSVLLIAFSELCLSWFNRNKEYKIISFNNVLKSSSNVLAAVFLGLKIISGGLILANVFSQILVCISYMRKIKFNSILDFSLDRLSVVFNKYIMFFKYSTLSSLFNSTANIGFPIFLVFLFDIKVAGLYFFAEKIIIVPISILVGSVSKVYFQEASVIYNNNKNNLLQFTDNIQKKIMLFLLPFLIIMSFLVEDLFVLLGEEWIFSGDLIKYFAIYLLFKNIYSPISSVADIFRKQKLLLFFNFSLVVSQILFLYFFRDQGIKIALLFSSIIGSIHYIGLNLYMRKLMRNA